MANPSFTGRSSAEWSGPKNPEGLAEFYVYQFDQQSSLAEALDSGEQFTVAWYYHPSDEEIAAGAKDRQRQVEVFDTGTNYLKVLKAMYDLRRTALEQRNFYVKGGFSPF